MESEFESDAKGNVRFDMVLNLAAGLFALLVFIIVLVSPIPNPKDEVETPKGTIMVESSWTSCEADVDTWVKGPNDIPVGYARKDGKTFNLVRDDLGHSSDWMLNENYENIIGRGKPPGEYIVNVHLYWNTIRSYGGCELPITVKVRVRLYSDAPGDNRTLEHEFKKVVTLSKVNQERTVFRFELDEEGNFIEDSMGNEFTKLTPRGRQF